MLAENSLPYKDPNTDVDGFNKLASKLTSKLLRFCIDKNYDIQLPPTFVVTTQNDEGEEIEGPVGAKNYSVAAKLRFQHLKTALFAEMVSAMDSHPNKPVPVKLMGQNNPSLSRQPSKATASTSAFKPTKSLPPANKRGAGTLQRAAAANVAEPSISSELVPAKSVTEPVLSPAGAKTDTEAANDDRPRAPPAAARTGRQRDELQGYDELDEQQKKQRQKIDDMKQDIDSLFHRLNQFEENVRHSLLGGGGASGGGPSQHNSSSSSRSGGGAFGSWSPTNANRVAAGQDQHGGGRYGGATSQFDTSLFARNQPRK